MAAGSRDNKYYFRLWCNHIRMIDTTRKEVTIGETQAYCLQCDDLKVVAKPASQSYYETSTESLENE